MTDKTDSKERGGIINSSDILLHDAKTALMYEELRAAIDDGHESMTHADALAEIAAIRAENEQLKAQLASIGAGGVSGPLMGRAFDAADMATASAQGFRDGIASLAANAGSEPVAWPTMPPSRGQSPVLFEDGYAEGWAKCLEMCKAATANPSPPEGMGGGWKCVPVEPTEAMLRAMDRACSDAMHIGIAVSPEAWAAGIEAAPPTSSADSSKEQP